MWLGCAALRLSLLLQGLGVVFGSLNATWLAPTPGCSPSLPAYASCVLADVCAPSYFVYDMGDIIRWSMVATNPTKVTQSYERVVHCTGPDVLVRTKCHPVVIRRRGGGPKDANPTCCNLDPLLGDPNFYGLEYPIALGSDFSTVTASGGSTVIDVFPLSHNVTRVDFQWNTSVLSQISLAGQLPLFNLSFSADYGFPVGQTNTSTCTKVLYFRLCIPPTFVIQGAGFNHTDSAGVGRMYQHVLGTPAFYASGNLTEPLPAHVSCGLAVQKPCLSPAVMIPGKGLVSTLSMSTPVSEIVQGWAFATELPDSAMTDFPPMGIRVGQEVFFTVRARSLVQGGNVSLTLVDDPGLPIGMNLGEQYECDQAARCWDVSWIPHKGMEGKIHEARFDARSPAVDSAPLVQGDARPKACAAKSGQAFSVRIPVTQPKSEWVPAGASLPLAHGFVGTRFTQTLTCRSNYMPLVLLSDGANMMGAVLQNRTQNYNAETGVHTTNYTFAYTPMRGDEGTTKKWCFTCGDDQMVQQRNLAPTRCVNLHTKLCSYTVSAGETLQTIARRYQLSANWLNVWNANPRITDPDLALRTETVIKLGPTYKVKAGDTLTSIAAEFSTTVKKLLAVNPSVDMVPGDEMTPGLLLCVLACTNQPSPSNDYKWAF